MWLTKIILCCVWQPIFDSFLFCNILLYKIISSSRSKIVAYFINRCRWCEMQIILLMPNVGFKRCCYSAIWDQTCPITRFYFTNHNRHQPTPSICSIGIWHARYSRLSQRATSLYSSVRKRVSLVLRRWTPARTISYRPFVKHQWFAVWCLYVNIAQDCELFKAIKGYTIEAMQGYIKLHKAK